MTQRRALVTGASSGIGAAAALALAEEGYSLWITYHTDEAAAEEVSHRCTSLGAEVHLSQLDLRSPAAIESVVRSIDNTWGELHVLVNNGGVCPYISYQDIETAQWDAVLETNARGTFLLSRAALPLLRANRGGESDRSVINLSSIAGEMGALQTGMHYAASKAAILAITRSFARLLASEGIRVNAVCPGPVLSSITEQLSSDARERLNQTIPLGRFGTAEEVAWIIVGLASPRASFVTGATYDVNGGVRID